MEKTVERKRIVYFDVLNVLACLCVVGMHCNGAVHAFSDSSVWRQSLLVDVLAYWAVPVFVMLSGATLMNYRRRYSTKVFLKRRFLKTGVPLVIWTVFFYVFYRTRGTIAWTGWRAFLNSVINFSIVPVYWFFPPLFMVYLSLPVLSLLVQNRKTLWYMTVLAFASCSVVPFVCTALGLTYWGSFAFPMMGGYLLFAVLGDLLHTTELSRLQRSAIYVLGILGIHKLADDSSGCCHFCIHKVCLRLSDFSKREIYPSHQMAFRGKFWNLLNTRAGYRSNYIVVFGRYIKRMVAAIRCVCGLFCRSAACKGIAEDPVCRQIFVSIKIYTVRIAELTVRFRPKG